MQQTKPIAFLPTGLILCAAAILGAQNTNPTSPAPQPAAAVQADNNVPLYRIQVVGREIPAVNYYQLKDQTKIGFQSTGLLPQAAGVANVKPQAGSTSIEAYFTGLPPASTLGPEYLTYVLWAVTPEGRAVNLGEVLPGGKKNEDTITVTTHLQSFGLVVTAEPYFAVTLPSDMVVVQNVVIAGKTKGAVESINAHYMLLPRGAYAGTAGRQANPVTSDGRSPLQLLEAENAVQIAEAAGATKDRKSVV